MVELHVDHVLVLEDKLKMAYQELVRLVMEKEEDDLISLIMKFYYYI